MASGGIQKRMVDLEDRLGCVFKDKDLLARAMVHRSYLNEDPEWTLGHNERLEFLGDAVLELIVTEHLYRSFTNTPEGELTEIRANLVNLENLARTGESIGLGDFLLMSKGEAQQFMVGSKSRTHIIGCAIETLIGAIYLDQGLGECRFFVDLHLLKNIRRIVEESEDPKTNLQELAQTRKGITPHYQVLHVEGMAHNREFMVGVYFAAQLMGEGKGSSKQEAEKQAAKDALAQLGWIVQRRLPERGKDLRRSVRRRFVRTPERKKP